MGEEIAVTKTEAIDFINRLRAKRKEKGEVFSGYMEDYSEYEDMNAYGFEFEGEWFDCWHEASDPVGAIKAVKLLFDISEDELE